MQLTKEQAIKEHRKMWNWIADQYKNGCIKYIYEVEQRYINECTNYSSDEIESDSFCCEYSNLCSKIIINYLFSSSNIPLP